MSTQLPAFYDPTKTYEDNFDNGPFEVPGFEKPYTNSGKPQFTFLGKPVYSPFGIGAGPLLNSTYVKYALSHGFDIVVYKTQRSGEFPVNPFPNVLYVETDGDLTLEKAAKGLVGSAETDLPADKISITNSFAVPSRGKDFWVPDLKKAISYAGEGQMVIASVVGTIKAGFGEEEYYNDFADVAEMAASANPPAIEVNLSCPNVASEGVLCYSFEAVVPIIKRVKKRVGSIPIGIKIGYFSAEQQELLERTVKAVAPYVSFISVINTIAAAVVDDHGEQALPGKGRLKSGICGAGVKWAGLDMVKRLDTIRKDNGYDFEIVGVGGVMSADDFTEYQNAGADIVHSCTGAMWNPGLAAEVKNALMAHKV